MRKLVRLILFNAGLLVLLVAVAWLAQRAPGLPADTPPATTRPEAPGVGQAAGPVQAQGGQLATGVQPAALTAPPVEPVPGSSVESPQPGPVSDPGDPLYNDAPTLLLPEPVSLEGPANVRHAHLSFEFTFDNHGPGKVLNLDVYVAIPETRSNQRISGLTFSAPFTATVDEYGQPLAHFRFPLLEPGERATVGWQGDVEIEARTYAIDPAQVTGLDTIPPDVIDTYVGRQLDRYSLDSRTIQNAARLAAGGATNPYWIARNVHDYVARRLSYDNDGSWDDAETVFIQRRGSCTEYAILYISLLRANGVPARYVAGTRQRDDGRYVDTLFHRWNEIYLPPYGWVPVDVLHDDSLSGPRDAYFGAISDERFVTTMSGGGSEYLGWNYHYGYRYDRDGQDTDVSRERRFVWEPYPQELRASPQELSAVVAAGTAEALLGSVQVVTTNGATDWSASISTGWLRLEAGTGTTPATVRVFADPAGLDPGLHTASLTIETASPAASVTIPIELLIVEE